MLLASATHHSLTKWAYDAKNVWKYSFFTTVLFETRKFPFFLFSKWKQKLFNDLFEVAQNAFNWILMNSFALLLPYYVGRWSTFHNVGLGTKIIINDIEVEILIECRVPMHILAYGGPALFFIYYQQFFLLQTVIWGLMTTKGFPFIFSISRKLDNNFC